MFYSEIDIVRRRSEQKPIGLGKTCFENVKEKRGTGRLVSTLGELNV